MAAPTSDCNVKFDLPTRSRPHMALSGRRSSPLSCLLLTHSDSEQSCRPSAGRSIEKRGSNRPKAPQSDLKLPSVRDGEGDNQLDGSVHRKTDHARCAAGMPATVTEHFYEEVGCAIQHRGVLRKHG